MAYKIPDFSQGRILVVGDVMLDSYWQGDIERISPEAPVPVVKVSSQNDCPGGAANVALNVAVLGAKVHLLGICGDDQAAQTLGRQLKKHQVDSLLIKDPNIKTVTKLRILGHRQQLVRLDFEGEALASVTIDQIKHQFEKHLAHVDIVILSDYAKGTLSMAPELIKMANARGVRVLVDPKSPVLSHYAGAYLITPNLKEYEALVGHCPTEAIFEQKGKALLEKNHLPALLVTRSEKGVSLFQKNKPVLHLPAHQQEVYDVTGAGDTVIAYIGASLAANASLEDAVKLANLAAGISVRKLNAATVSVGELRREIWRQTASFIDRHILSEEELITAVQDARLQNETIVMTNGCFDILHPGHVAYLEEAKKLGDRLIVAVNDDDSVRQLKGENRPINPLVARMQVLAGLRSVDWVVPFGEKTPERLITQVMPDVLVKAGDYKVDEIAGHKQVLANNGQVLIMNYVDGYSTTRTMQKILEN